MARKQLGSNPSGTTDAATKSYVDTGDTAAKARANHTGTQTASTISDFSTAADARITAATGTSVQPYDADLAAIAALTATTNNFLISVSSAWASRTPAQARTTLNVADGATANSSDATLLARANHTGTQSADTITDGSTNKAYTATEKTKLAGIASGATVNDTSAMVSGSNNGSAAALTLWIGTAAQYAAIGTKNSSTVYVVTP